MLLLTIVLIIVFNYIDFPGKGIIRLVVFTNFTGFYGVVIASVLWIKEANEIRKAMKKIESLQKSMAVSNVQFENDVKPLQLNSNQNSSTYRASLSLSTSGTLIVRVVGCIQMIFACGGAIGQILGEFVYYDLLTFGYSIALSSMCMIFLSSLHSLIIQKTVLKSVQKQMQQSTQENTSQSVAASSTLKQP